MSAPAAGGRFVRALAFVRFSHTVFALPFALGSMLVAADGWPGWRIFGLILLAMIFARTAAMGFNRLADWEIDKRNPRTAGRHRLVSRIVAIEITVVSAGAFIGAAAFINPLCFALSPVALAVVFFYSLTKRFTDFTQVFLGLALAVSPVGAWLAVTGAFAWPPFWLALAVLLWVAGFDLIYATQDVEFDRRAGLRSMVVRLGIPRSLRLAQALHAGMFAGLLVFGLSALLGVAYFGGLALIFLALLHEHRVARSHDLGAINVAFFKVNAWVGAIFLAALIADTLFF